MTMGKNNQSGSIGDLEKLEPRCSLGTGWAKNTEKKASSSATPLAVCLVCLFFCKAPIHGADVRTIPLDLYIIIDGSAALQEGKQAASDWICGYVIDTLLMEGDVVTLWIATDSPEQRYSGAIAGNDSKEAIKRIIRATSLQGNSADYAAALREVERAARARENLSQRRLSYTLVIGGSLPGHSSFPVERETAELLRYSRVTDFSGWLVLSAALGIRPQVQEAASSYIQQ